MKKIRSILSDYGTLKNCRILGLHPNNGVEGWNSNWNSTCSRRPNWWSYLTHLQMEEGLSCMRWREMRDGTYKDPNPGRSARRKAKQELIKSILDQFVEDKDLDSFFTSLLYKI